MIQWLTTLFVWIYVCLHVCGYACLCVSEGQKSTLDVVVGYRLIVSFIPFLRLPHFQAPSLCLGPQQMNPCVHRKHTRCWVFRTEHYPWTLCLGSWRCNCSHLLAMTLCTFGLVLYFWGPPLFPRKLGNAFFPLGAWIVTPVAEFPPHLQFWGGLSSDVCHLVRCSDSSGGSSSWVLVTIQHITPFVSSQAPGSIADLGNLSMFLTCCVSCFPVCLFVGERYVI